VAQVRSDFRAFAAGASVFSNRAGAAHSIHAPRPIVAADARTTQSSERGRERASYDRAPVPNPPDAAFTILKHLQDDVKLAVRVRQSAAEALGLSR
jgi:hypothetical protein